MLLFIFDSGHNTSVNNSHYLAMRFFFFEYFLRRKLLPDGSLSILVSGRQVSKLNERVVCYFFNGKFRCLGNGSIAAGAVLRATPVL